MLAAEEEALVRSRVFFLIEHRFVVLDDSFLERAPHMERLHAVLIVALDAGARVLLASADVAGQPKPLEVD